MCSANRIGYVVAAVALGLTAACSSLPAPRDWVPDADQAPKDPRGSWANVRHIQNNNRVTTSGELISVSQDSVFIALPKSRLAPFAWKDINRLQVVYFDPHEGLCYGIGAAGAVSTLSHGYILVMSLPAWMIIGATTGAGRVGEAMLTYPSETEDWRDLRAYARFPQGLSRVERSALSDSMLAAARAPADTVRTGTGKISGEPAPPVPKYKPAEHIGNGFLLGGGFFEQGKGVWTLGYSASVFKELFVMGGYSAFDDDAIDMNQVWMGVRLGDPVFFGVKYIYTDQDLPDTYFAEYEEETSGVSFFGGFLTPTSRHIGVGAMGGLDLTGLEFPEGRDDLWWAQLVLQVTLFPAD
jgi:hypothetical protein